MLASILVLGGLNGAFSPDDPVKRVDSHLEIGFAVASIHRHFVAAH